MIIKDKKELVRIIESHINELILNINYSSQDTLSNARDVIKCAQNILPYLDEIEK